MFTSFVHPSPQLPRSIFSQTQLDDHNSCSAGLGLHTLPLNKKPLSTMTAFLFPPPLFSKHQPLGIPYIWQQTNTNIFSQFSLTTTCFHEPYSTTTPFHFVFKDCVLECNVSQIKMFQQCVLINFLEYVQQ